MPDPQPDPYKVRAAEILNQVAPNSWDVRTLVVVALVLRYLEEEAERR